MMLALKFQDPPLSTGLPTRGQNPWTYAELAGDPGPSELETYAGESGAQWTVVSQGYTPSFGRLNQAIAPFVARATPRTPVG